MISNLIPKDSDRPLNTAGATDLHFADCDDCFPFLTVSLKGTFEHRGATFLEFKVAMAEGIVLDGINITNPQDHVIHIEMKEDLGRPPAAKEYFLMIEGASSLATTTMTFTATRKSKKSVWKYTKASGPMGAPGKKSSGDPPQPNLPKWWWKRRSI